MRVREIILQTIKEWFNNRNPRLLNSYNCFWVDGERFSCDELTEILYKKITEFQDAKQTEIHESDSLGKEEWYALLYRCPKCKGDFIWKDFEYCPNCGVKIGWK